MTPHALMPHLEGLVGTGLRAPRAPQAVMLWLECMKMIMHSQVLRGATDWNVASAADVISASGNALDTTGGTVYGVLVDSIYDVATEDLIVIVTAGTAGTAFTAETGVDFGGSEFLEDEGIIVMRMPTTLPAGSANADFGLWLDPYGQVFPTRITSYCDGQEGTAPTANDVRIYVVYREDTEARV